MFLHRAGHRPEDNKMQEVGQGAGKGQEDFSRVRACGHEAQSGGVNTGDPTKALKVAELWRGMVGIVK